MRRLFIFSILTLALYACKSDSDNAIDRKEAIDFLYSTMSLPDKADYPREFYERNVDIALKARDEMPWGKTVPEREFKHFVLPVRVNNEHLDDSRSVFYEELKDRVKGLSMEDAILEVNHWCHEKVTYRPSDGRTSSPLSSVSQAIGRCGEESTFTVAALRSVGIPARQIYTPRWAHTDDNHAWVEVWANGKWYFLGACEPEPVLNLAWFNDPASRGILMSTNVAGNYDGPEEVLFRDSITTRINVTQNYAPTGEVKVKVLTPDMKPAPGANVNFCIYNYSEFYPAVTKKADENGSASLRAGLGDMIVWASDGKNYGFAKVTASQEPETVEVVMDKNARYAGEITLDLIPPPSGASLPVVTEEQRELNNRRMQQEDSIRNAYISTFANPESAIAFASQSLSGKDAEEMAKFLVLSRGNHTMLENMLKSLPENQRHNFVKLLGVVSEKDLRDIPEDVIADVISNSLTQQETGFSDDVYFRYVMNPRVENEHLYPWRKELKSNLPASLKAGDSETLVKWTLDSISLADDENPQKLRMSPGAVLRERKADRLSRAIFFVAAARTLGIAARIDPVTGATQYMEGGKWKTVDLSGAENVGNQSDVKTGFLSIVFTPQGHIIDPKYYSQFSISKIEGGIPRQLEFPEEGTVSSIFKKPVELEAGQYMLISGQRLANGGVLSCVEFFNIEPGETVKKELKIRTDDSALSVIGNLNAENIYHDLESDADKSILSTTGRGYYIAALISPNHEPSTHALNDISAVAADLEKSGMKLLLLFDSEADAARFKKDAFPKLPKNVVFGIDNGNVSRNEILSSLHLEEAVNPVFVVADTFNRIVWVSTGYTIGMGDQLLNVISRLKK